MKKIYISFVAIALASSAMAQNTQDLFSQRTDNVRAGTGFSLISQLQTDASVKSFEFINVNTAALAQNVIEVNMNLGNGIAFTAFQNDAYNLDGESIVWSGEIDLDTMSNGKVDRLAPSIPLSATSNALFVVTGDRVIGQINIEGITYELLTTEEGGNYLLVERDLSKLPDGDDTPRTANGGKIDSAASSNLIPETTRATNTIIRVLQFATRDARDQAGGRNSVRDRMRFFLSQANTVYRNNGIQIRLRNAGIRTPNTRQGTNNAGTLLNQLTNTSDGRWDSFAGNLRNSRNADIVAMVTNSGIFIPSGGRNIALCGIADAISARAADGFFIVSQSCTGFTFVHELGHLMGARHDNDPTTSPFSFGHGFVNTGRNFRTVMAVSSNPQPRIGFFSTDDQNTNGGSLGNSTFADNERVHQQRRSTVAGFR